jgi:molecular chaperone IbpA|tara:strand:- start:177 stop:629 length:453 start_codon:yes stop_codon:yes gene_type:complete
MRTFDFSPLFRTTVGFDRMARALDTLADEPANSFPPYNIESMGEDAYRITMAIAGFSEKDIEIIAQDAQLVVSGRIDRSAENEERQYLHRGIAERAFERRFNLAEHVAVTEATMENGLLHIELIREIPEEKKPRKIAISSIAKTLENKAA